MPTGSHVTSQMVHTGVTLLAISTLEKSLRRVFRRCGHLEMRTRNEGEQGAVWASGQRKEAREWGDDVERMPSS
jgi:hypothetical protein